MDELPVAELIKTYGTTNIARAMGLPISTIHTWMRADAIPGAPKEGQPRNVLHDMKVEAFKAAVKKLKKDAKREGRQPRKRAA